MDHNKCVIWREFVIKLHKQYWVVYQDKKIEVLTSFMKLPRTLKFPKIATCNCQHFNEKNYTYVICANVIFLYNMKINNVNKNINLSLNIASSSFFKNKKK